MAKVKKKEPEAVMPDRLKSDFTETEKVIFRRRSVRLYKKEQVPEFMIKRMLEAGRFAPSAGNSQPWKFIVLRDKDLIHEFEEDTAMLLNRMKNMIDYRVEGKEWLRPITKTFTRMRYNDLHWVPWGAVSLIADRRLALWHGAPSVILIFKDVRGVGNPDLDCGIAGQNMVLAAHSMGLGTCWVSFSRPGFEYMLKWRKFFKIEYPYKFMTSLAIGWPRGEPDGMVSRQTHAVDWYENGHTKTLY